jgi:hypothetical protein
MPAYTPPGAYDLEQAHQDALAALHRARQAEAEG